MLEPRPVFEERRLGYGVGAAALCGPNLLISLATSFASQVSLRLPTLSPHIQCHPQVARPVAQTPAVCLPRSALQVCQGETLIFGDSST